MIEIGLIEPDDYEIRCEDEEWEDLTAIVERARVLFHSGEIYLHVNIEQLDGLLAEMRETDGPPGLLDRRQTMALFSVVEHTNAWIIPGLSRERQRDLVERLDAIDIWELFEKADFIRYGRRPVD
jgi:hypothetical protein